MTKNDDLVDLLLDYKANVNNVHTREELTTHRSFKATNGPLVCASTIPHIHKLLGAGAYVDFDAMLSFWISDRFAFVEPMTREEYLRLLFYRRELVASKLLEKESSLLCRLFMRQVLPMEKQIEFLLELCQEAKVSFNVNYDHEKGKYNVVGSTTLEQLLCHPFTPNLVSVFKLLLAYGVCHKGIREHVVKRYGHTSVKIRDQLLGIINNYEVKNKIFYSSNSRPTSQVPRESILGLGARARARTGTGAWRSVDLQTFVYLQPPAGITTPVSE